MPWTRRRVSLSTMIATLRVQVALRDQSRPSTRSRANPPLEDSTVEPELAVLDPVGEQLARPGAVLGWSPGALEPRLEVDALVLALERLHAEAGLVEHPAPLLLGVVADVGRVVEPIGFLPRLAEEKVVGEEDEGPADARHLPQRARRILEVVRCDAARDDVEARVGEGNVLGA